MNSKAVNLINLNLHPKNEIDNMMLFLFEILENSSQPFASGFSNGSLIYCNQAFCELIGYTKEELCNISWTDDFVPPQWRKYEANFIEKLNKTGKPQRYEIEYLCKDGKMVPVEILVHRAYDTNLSAVFYYGYITDISERKQMQEELRKCQEDRFAVVFNASPCGMSIIDLNGRYIDVNTSYERITGYTKCEILGKTIFDLDFAEQEELENVMEILNNSDSFRNNEVKMKIKNGNFRMLSIALKKIKFGGKEYILSISDDITEQKTLEQELKNSNELFKNAFNLAPFPMAITSIKEARIIELNQTFLETFGYDREEVIGDTVFNFNFWADIKLRSKVMQELKHKEYFKNFEVVFLTKSGNKKNILLSGRLIAFNGELCILGLMNDITDLKHAEQERQIFQKEMARLDFLNVVGEMASGIGHEIRNPMTSVRGFLQLLANKETDSKKLEYYDLMIGELDRANLIISEYLSLSKDRIVELQHSSLNEIIIALYPLLNSDAIKQDKHIALNKSDLPDILINEKEIRQLIINIVRNAIEASPPMGIITISTSVYDGEVILSIQDKGTGIPPEIYEKLGTPFVTTKDSGTGLGLSICYSIAHRHNAKIDVKTGETGTIFYIRFKIPEQ
ncbi:PAS domain S-box protein [Phosphitispora sp. TUW77]|uniref:PAS domain S-box protein n=1 Tax=Phosphitispora sp. TUW77 TaxID=3152361 RepID=UPI003AB38F44